MSEILNDLRKRFMRRSPRPGIGPEGQQREVEMRKALQALTDSGLFTPEWYLLTYGDVFAAKVDPLDHFLRMGWREGRRPNPYFDPAWYLKTYPDIAASKINPLVHYWRYGEQENRQPVPIFDTEWYRHTYGEEIGDRSPLAHYLQNRHLRKFSPNRCFDIAFYLESNPDVAAADVDPFEHFITTGYREGRNPSASFDIFYYTRKHLRDDPRDPLTHYFEVGRAAGYLTYHDPSVPSAASEIRRFTSKSPDFEEFNPLIAGSRRRAKCIAFYLPQFHAFPENDRWWGTGFTEWTNVARGTPRFVGHYQPRVPRDFGFYDLSRPDILPRQVEAAKAAGLHGFCFYYYNFNGQRLLQKPTEDFLSRREIDFPFCILWANENWTRRWDGAETEILIQQDYRREDAEALIDDLARHFADPRYIRLRGRPLVILYRPDVIPEPKETLAHWRKLFESRHGEHPLILMAQAFDNVDPMSFGFDGAVEFPPHKVVKNVAPANSACDLFDEEFSGRVYRYDDIIAAATTEPPPHFPLIKTVFPSWDNDARRQGQGLSIIASTPQKYGAWLDKAISYANVNLFHGESLVFINAWNEWAEGTYLEPDIHFGSAYLNATARAISGVGMQSGQKKILLVGHDAFPAGAQLLLLNLAKTLSQQFGFNVRVLLCADGELAPRYREIAPVVIAPDRLSLATAARQATEDGYICAITNTVGTGNAVQALHDAGARVLSLVHEMPRIILEKNLEAEARLIAAFANEVVFPAASVREAFFETLALSPSKAMIRPQGIYHRLLTVPGARESVIAELQLRNDTQFVVNVGYGDLRKGVDLFCATAQLVADKIPNVHFLWVGKLERGFEIWYAQGSLPRNVHFLGQRSDVARLLSAADVFALTSREDPFPSVVLEALSLGMPVIGFEGAGGFVDLLGADKLGQLVPNGDTIALSQAIVRTLQQDKSALIKQGREIRNVVVKRFSFDDYAFELAERLEATLKRVSVIVPNYNYARYLHDRLASIFGQTHPVFEIIVLDDHSTDGSIHAAESIALAARREIHLIANDQNSGNVFSQWAKGVAKARGDLIWIAEADDLADLGFLERMSSFFDDPEMTLAFSDSGAIDGNGRPLRATYKDYYSRVASDALSHDLVESSANFARKYLSQRNLILNVSAVLWRRDRLARVLEQRQEALTDYKLAGDWLLYLAACAIDGKVGYCASSLNLHRRHAQGVTSQTRSDRQVDEIQRVQSYCLEKFGSDESTKKRQSEYLDELKNQFEVLEAERTECAKQS